MPKYTAGAGSTRKDKVAAGEYNLAVKDAAEKTSSNGNPMIELKLDVLGPVNGDQFDEDSGPLIYDNLVFTQNAFWKIDQFRNAIGEEVKEGEEVDIDPDDLIGATLTAHVVVGKNDKGMERNEIGAYLTGEENPF